MNRIMLSLVYCHVDKFEVFSFCQASWFESVVAPGAHVFWNMVTMV